jgi:hypothetical protein
MSKIGTLEWNNKYVLLYTDHSGFKRYNIIKQASLTWPLCTEHLKTREGVSISVKSPFSIKYSHDCFENSTFLIKLKSLEI